MAVDGGINPEMAVLAHWNAQFLAFSHHRAQRLGLQAVAESLELASEREEHEDGREDADPRERHLQRLAERQAHCDERAQEQDHADRIISDYGRTVDHLSSISRPSYAGAAQSGSSAARV